MLLTSFTLGPFLEEQSFSHLAVSPSTTNNKNMADEKVQVGYAEKGASDVEQGSSITSPAEYDDLPDPDVGKSDAKRAKLVGPHSFPTPNAR